MTSELGALGWRQARLWRRQAWELQNRVPALSPEEKADNRRRAEDVERRAAELEADLTAAGCAEPAKCVACEMAAERKCEAGEGNRPREWVSRAV
jgi:hypothetical protein